VGAERAKAAAAAHEPAGRFRLAPGPSSGPPARITFPRTLHGHTSLQATFRNSGAEATITLAATLAAADGTPLARAGRTLGPGEAAAFALPFPAPAHGPHRLILEAATPDPGPAGLWAEVLGPVVV
jgi:hypothetical protein